MPDLEIPTTRSPINLMVDGAANLGIIVTEYQVRQFERYLAELVKWNSKINLSGITDKRQIVIKHFLDSLLYLKGLELQGDEQLVDIGSGAGFPGLPLKLVKPKLQVTLLDARLKKIAFLKQLCQRLKLEGVNCIQGRAEGLAGQPQHYQKYNVAVARALTQLDRLIGLAFPYMVPGGRLVVSYGAQVNRQLRLAGEMLDKQAGSLEKVCRVSLPHSNELRNIVVIRKCFT